MKFSGPIEIHVDPSHEPVIREWMTPDQVLTHLQKNESRIDAEVAAYIGRPWCISIEKEIQRKVYSMFPELDPDWFGIDVTINGDGIRINVEVYRI